MRGAFFGMGVWAAAAGAAFAQCGVLLQQESTIAQDVSSFRSWIWYDSDGEGPLAAELLVGTDKGRVFAYNGTRWRQFGPAMVDPGVTYTEFADPQVYHLLMFRGALHAVAAGRVSNTNGSIFRWNGTGWTAAARFPACGPSGLISGWFLAATVHEGEMIVAGSNLRCGNLATTALAWNGTSWRRVGDAPFVSPSVNGALLSTRDGRLLLGGAMQRNSPFESVLIAELVNGVWTTRLRGTGAGNSIAVLGMQELDGEVLACGSMALNFSTPPVRVMKETANGWEAAEPYNTASAPPVMEIVHKVFADGDRRFVVGGTSDGLGGMVLVTPGGTTTVALPYGGARRLSGGMVRARDRYFALGGTSAGAGVCTLAPGMLTARVEEPLSWATLPTLVTATTGQRTGATSVAAAGGALVAAQSDQPGLMSILRATDCNADSATAAHWDGTTWRLPGERLGFTVRHVLDYNGAVTALGDFSVAGTRPITRGLARWDGSAWQSFPVGITPAGANLQHGVVWNGRLVAADNRSSTCTVRQFDGTAWSAMGSAFTGVFVGKLAVAGSRLFFAATSDDLVYEWNGTAWTRLGDDATTPSVVNIAGYGNDVVISTTTAESASVMRWNGTTWEALGGFPPNGTGRPQVRVLREHRGVLYAGLQGTVASVLSPLMRLEGNAWVTAVANPRMISGDPAALQTIHELAPDGDVLHIAGEFLQLGGFAFEAHARYYLGPPRILTMPAAESVVGGRTAYFSIEPEVYHDPGQVYRWRRNGVALADGATGTGSVIAGAGTAYLRIENAGTADVGEYGVVVTNGCGETASSAAGLTITCPADVDDGSGTGVPDGGVTVDDLLYYLGLFEAGDVRADVDDGSGLGVPDGGVTIDDLLYYLVRYAGGC